MQRISSPLSNWGTRPSANEFRFVFARDCWRFVKRLFEPVIAFRLVSTVIITGWRPIDAHLEFESPNVKNEQLEKIVRIDFLSELSDEFRLWCVLCKARSLIRLWEGWKKRSKSPPSPYKRIFIWKRYFEMSSLACRNKVKLRLSALIRLDDFDALYASISFVPLPSTMLHPPLIPLQPDSRSVRATPSRLNSLWTYTSYYWGSLRANSPSFSILDRCLDYPTWRLLPSYTWPVQVDFWSLTS